MGGRGDPREGGEGHEGKNGGDKGGSDLLKVNILH